MIISDTYKFAFIHIPKCAGSTVRKANPTINDPFLEQHFYEHETLGNLHFAHLPLWVLRDYFPELMKRLLACESFAVTREPMERFCSALMQRCRGLGYAVTEITPDVLTDVGLDTVHILRTNENILDVRYAHFIPQAQFIMLDGKQVVDHIDLVGDFRHLNTFLKGKGLNAISESPQRNMSVEPAFGIVKPVVKPIQLLGRRMLSQKVKDKLWRKLVTSGFLAPRRGGYAELQENSQIAGFVQEYYAEDYEIYRRVVEDNKD